MAKSDDALTEEVIDVAAAGTPADAFRVMAFSVSGIDLSGTGVDSNASLPAWDGGANGTPTMTGLSTTAANTVLLFFNAQDNSVSGTYSATPPTGFTLIAEAHDGRTGLEAFFQVVSSAQTDISIALSGSSNSHSWVVIGDALLTLAAANVTPDNDPRWVKINGLNDHGLTAKFGSTVGGIPYLDSDGVWKALTPGSSGQFLGAPATAGDPPSYQTPSSGSTYAPILGITRLHLTSNTTALAANAWSTVSWATADEDNLSAWSSSTPSHITVPAGVTKARIRCHVTWQNGGSSNRFLALSTGTGAFGGLGGDIRTASNEGLATVVTPWVPVTAADYIYCSVNPGSLSLYLQGGSFGSMFGGPTAVEVEWR